jgi:hypothetical protein
MDIGVRAAQLISEVTPHLFLTAAQVTLQQNNNSSASTTSSSTPSQIKSEICEPSAMSAATVERDNTPESSEDENEKPAGDEEEFEVEQILDTKMSGRKRLFKVRWKNYGPEWDTWEPEDSLKDGAEESMKEFMIQYEANKKSKNSKSRKRPSATPASAASKTTRSRRSTVEDADDESLHDSGSSSDGEGFTPSSKKKAKANNASSKTSTPSRNRSARTTTSSPTKPSAVPPITSSNGFLSNVKKTPWFMDSSSEDEGNISKEKQNDTNSKSATPTKDIASSSSLKLVIKSHKNTPDKEDDANNSDKDAAENDIEESSSSKKHKKDKHKKKNKKPKVELIFEGIYRKGHGEPLSFVAQQTGSDQTTTYSLEEAIEADSKSLARFLADKVTFVAEGIPSVNVINASTSSATFSSTANRV